MYLLRLFLRHFFLAIVLTGIACSSAVAAVDSSSHPRLAKIVSELVSEGVYTQAELNEIFASAELQEKILEAMTSPAEYKFTWGKYRKLFIQEERIEQGVDFWLEHADAFEQVEQKYGVPASMIVAILGVESKFGRIKGKHKVLDALVTLIVGFERRSEFFASELKHFLLLSKENKFDPTAILGSYAGAVGYPQFISSSYRNYAVDFNGDGITDLIDQPEDAIGSIANYFVENGWKKGRPVTSIPHSEVPPAVADLASRKRKAQHSAAKLRGLGAPLDQAVADDELLGVLMMNASEIVPDDSKRNVYIVRAGDTACQIAERHNVACKELFKLNKLNDRGAIFRGQRLKLPRQALTPKKVSDDSNWKVSGAATVAVGKEIHNQEIPQYFFTHHNFYVITRYNQSVLYAMAVQDLSTGLAASHARRTSEGSE